MFPIKTVKEEMSDENYEINELNNKEFKIEVKMEEIDPLAVTNFDENPLNADNVKMETNEVDYEALYVKDEFDSEIVEQELENNDEIINKPVIIGDPEAALNNSSKSLIVLSKTVFLDIETKAKSEDMKTLLSQFQEDREVLLLKNAELKKELALIMNKHSRHSRTVQILNKKVALLENQAKSTGAKLKEAYTVSKQLQSKVDEMLNHICLLSANNSKLEAELESLQGKEKEMKLVSIKLKAERKDGKMFTEKDLKDMIISLVKENNIIESQLGRKTDELKKMQEKYGKAIIALSQERRKTEELTKMMNITPEVERVEENPTFIMDPK